MKPTVYLETTVISYLAARQSRDLIVAAWQEITREWWASRRATFDLFVSPLVHQEADGGDPGAAAKRREILKGIRTVPVTPEAVELAQLIVARAGIPEKAAADALHIATAAVNSATYLLTWNCRHIAGASYRAGIQSACRNAGFSPPVICTPAELMED